MGAFTIGDVVQIDAAAFLPVEANGSRIGWITDCADQADPTIWRVSHRRNWRKPWTDYRTAELTKLDPVEVQRIMLAAEPKASEMRERLLAIEPLDPSEMLKLISGHRHPETIADEHADHPAMTKYLDGLDALTDGRGYGQEHEEARRFVKRACECHEELLAACKAMIELECIIEITCCSCEGPCEANNFEGHLCGLHAALKLGKAAIAKAEAGS